MHLSSRSESPDHNEPGPHKRCAVFVRGKPQKYGWVVPGRRYAEAVVVRSDCERCNTGQVTCQKCCPRETKVRLRPEKGYYCQPKVILREIMRVVPVSEWWPRSACAALRVVHVVEFWRGIEGLVPRDRASVANK
ncbi:uncharacterized protein N7500_000252 [Penicillium coprophilum]|uniref:uncharacterized protein n=1 Tax=Penicillium coprophilum TaxID=36646 RepID=UPI002392CD5D|nr:uncharacterized protein N7500_000252 [Penicillium coprophilum]KAJ5177553.1 hypothetical protein N7500_000252 [Penicillium coprophilum]